MFGKVASDMLGLSDIGTIIKPENYDKVDADDYLMHEDGEKIFFLIKSKADEYCFTNHALIHLDGTSAVSKKRMLKRYTYKSYRVEDVRLETAGTVDRDVEIKFSIGGQSFSIDVDKRQIESLKDLYKALVQISSIQHNNAEYYAYASNSLGTAAESVRRSSGEASLETQFKAINEYAFEWMKKAHATYVRKDFSEVFEKYINN
ncbi:YvbH-like oligomerisation region [Catalinimonas alkaloidigena]|uniref:YvbH-like oligomerisation region n=1 Tax=Catalinimonas alkaloidigena TaxID=1075417 RepID=A0A1G9RCF9_9BACT|nr:PH domain-containing protein [Catalinimonas alkaloidigena]SDM21002.1 YvbH-like oligomerisation region [Catalinimonas alkaloidigena]